jgi:Glycosyl transferase family 2
MPDLSVIVLTPDNYAPIRRLMAHLGAQTARSRLEIVLLAPEPGRLQADEGELAGFAGVRMVEANVMRSTAEARAAGVRAATAPIVVFTEDHSLPEPAWAESLIRAHEGTWAVVGPAVSNANPRSAVSWANLLIEYIEWLHPAAREPVRHVPGHNSAYKRDVLLRYGAALGERLEVESLLHWDLAAAGHRLLLEPAARTRHLNYSRLSASIPLRFWSGRLFAARRSRDWSPGRRLLYIAGAPLIPAVRLARILRQLRRPGRRIPRPAAVLPLTAFLLACNTAGEAAGYALGAGTAPDRLVDLDFRRERFMSAADRREFGRAPAAEGDASGAP